MNGNHQLCGAGPTETSEYPVLGEPIPIEFANTRYHDGAEIVDFLATPLVTEGWFENSPTASRLVRPARWSAGDHAELTRLRDAVESLLRAWIIGSTAPRAVDIEVLNRAAARTRSHPTLVWDRTPSRVDRRDHRSRLDAALGTIAAESIDLLTGPFADAVRVCANDDCQMMFLRTHHRRRWCHNSCGHRHRQAVYSRRVHQRDLARRPTANAGDRS